MFRDIFSFPLSTFSNILVINEHKMEVTVGIQCGKTWMELANRLPQS